MYQKNRPVAPGALDGAEIPNAALFWSLPEAVYAIGRPAGSISLGATCEPEFIFRAGPLAAYVVTITLWQMRISPGIADSVCWLPPSAQEWEQCWWARRTLPLAPDQSPRPCCDTRHEASPSTIWRMASSHVSGGCSVRHCFTRASMSGGVSILGSALSCLSAASIASPTFCSRLKAP